MTLTLGHGPLSNHLPATVNYRLDGPDHSLFMQPFPRRVRAEFNGEILLDTVNGMMLNETGYLPQLYVPEADVVSAHLEPTEHTTRCPFKGVASYWTVRVGDKSSENAVWGYQDPIESASWLRGYQAFYFDHMDAWWDEDEQVFPGLRDPYHRTDVRKTSRRVRVLLGDNVIAEAASAHVLSENGLPNRIYLPREAVRAELVPSTTVAVCPYKGTASYWSLKSGDELVPDAAWTYPEPFDSVAPIKGAVSFDHPSLTVEIADR